MIAMLVAGSKPLRAHSAHVILTPRTVEGASDKHGSCTVLSDDCMIVDLMTSGDSDMGVDCKGQAFGAASQISS